MLKNKIKVFRELGIITVFIMIFVILSIISPTFLRPLNLINITRQTVEIGIIAIGMTFLIISAEMDLSVGSVFGVTAMFAALLFKSGMDATVVFFLAILLGCSIGLINGVLVTKLKMPAFIATLGTMQIFRSISYSISGGRSISVFPEQIQQSWVFQMGDTIGVIPIQVVIMLILFIYAHIILKKTKIGFDLYATGGNERAAELAGINTSRIKIVAFVITGALCALAGLISIAYLQSVPTTAGVGREMDVIAAVILGGASLKGGRGTILGTFVGAMIMSIIKNGMVLLTVPVFWQTGFIGAIIILAVSFDTWIIKE